MTPVQRVYDAFLSKMLEEEWLNWTDEEIQHDWRMLLDGAIPNFKFPRASITQTKSTSFKSCGDDWSKWFDPCGFA